MPVERLEPRATAVELMDAAVEAAGSREALVDGEVRLSFADWDRAADGVAALFEACGLHRGDVVCLQLPSSADYAICYQAAMRLGAVTSGVNPRFGPRELAHVLERCRPKVTVAEDGSEPAPLAGRVLGRSAVRQAWGEGRPSRRPVPRPSDPVAIVWTSATTGRPKGAVFDHENLVAVAAGAGDLSRPGDRRLSPLPFCHVGYMTRPVDEISNLITTVVVPSPWRAREALRLMVEEKVTVAQGVPTQWRMLLDLPELEGADLSCLRVAGTGGSSVAPELVRQMRQRLGCPVVVGYTSTEAAITTRSRIGDSDEDVALTVGRASEGVEVEVVDEQGRRLGSGHLGQVRCRSGAVMRGYWKDPELTASVLDRDGWLATGDLGRLDSRGYLTLVGRQSDMYIRGGYNVYPAEVEAVLCEHPSVAEAAVVGVPDPRLGEVGAAFVVPAGPGADRGELRRWCASRVADYKAPDEVWLVESLPVTAMSKVDKAALAEQARRARRRGR
ncbi:MAG TPA: AMP-binding protein [Acidimicrobiales bacterium]|nr:AMP-binding protein [Acidimicrobiales bacterium]